jgi:hypothetical protein
MTQRLPLSEAALRLTLDYQQCRRLVLTGQLPGGRDEFGRLFVYASAVDDRLATRAEGVRPHD